MMFAQTILWNTKWGTLQRQTVDEALLHELHLEILYDIYSVHTLFT